MDMMTKADVMNTVNANYRALEAACGKAGLERLLDRLLETCERQEKEHLAFGRRLLGRNPKRQHSITLTARYFAVKVVASEEHIVKGEGGVDKTLAYLARCREDYQIGAMLGAALAMKCRNAQGGFTPTESFAQLDYSEHFATKE